MGESRGSIFFFGTYRPPVPLDIFSCPADPPPSSAEDELLLTDDASYNQNGRPVPPAALKEILGFLRKTNPELASDCGATLEDVDAGHVTGMVFVSERDRGLETLHLALRRSTGGEVKVLSLLGDIYGLDDLGVRMEDSGCIAGGYMVDGVTVGHSLVYVSTKEEVKARRTPWTVVYRTDLADGKTERLTPQGQYDLSPAVSPSGKMVAVANFQKSEWNGEIENLKTDIVIMEVHWRGLGGDGRRRVIKDAGWPTWGSDNVIFFHRGFDKTPPTNTADWAVFRYDLAAHREERVTPVGIDAMTPAAISETRVAVATVRQKSKQVEMMVERVMDQYRHVEIFDTTTPSCKPPSVQITQRMRPLGDHYNPFVLDGGRRIGYHRCRTDKLTPHGEQKSIEKRFDKVQSGESEVGLYRVTGVFPSISKNGKKLAFVDNEFQAVWLVEADSEAAPRIVYKAKSNKSVFSTSWNQNDELDTLYVCEGPAFSIEKPVQIIRIPNVSTHDPEEHKLKSFALTDHKYNCAFPSTNPEGTKLVFRSSRDRVQGGKREDKNLFIIDAEKGEYAGVDQLTNGPWTDTHCSWSPREGCDWIVFSSSRGKPGGAPASDHGLDSGYFSVYLVNAKDMAEGVVPVRVIHSAPTIAGHVNHPVFSPDMMSIVFTADLAAVSVDPISMPHFMHSVRPYGDIFSVELLDREDMAKNKDIHKYHRITHSRYEYSTPTWSPHTDGEQDPNTRWKMLERVPYITPRCPYARGQHGEKEGWHMTGHLIIDKRSC
ncbi:hypothetical protein CFC21_081114 [Triticum aestivum]|uniref:Protein TolB n=4 Tax=Triticinae TaxID=1648030 RepID=A0A453MK00_AEGTS|nr:uncharacterized protein LOC109759880 [Aegilops tauschii subsp. strangulata]XP_044400480.1 uncharacterized protein LOC123123898 [Triticum aestivum]KAF7076473.1 hypothetical protein CFC21_081114 [Triticum aestivum]